MKETHQRELEFAQVCGPLLCWFLSPFFMVRPCVLLAGEATISHCVHFCENPIRLRGSIETRRRKQRHGVDVPRQQ